MTLADLQALVPIILIAAGAVVVMLTVAFCPRPGLLNGLTVLSILVTIVALLTLDVSAGRQVTPLIVIDSFAVFFSLLLCFATLVIVLQSHSYFAAAQSGNKIACGEYYILILVATLGGMVMASSNHFASFFIGLELLGVSIYVLVAYLAHHTQGREQSLEAGIKYLILSGVASALLLFGIALIYAEFGSLEFNGLAAAWRQLDGLGLQFAEIGLALIMAGVCFKLSLVPFHMWTPDVYQGAPAPATAFIATVSKGAIFAVLLRLFVSTGLFEQPIIFFALAVIAILSMLGGNVLALRQANIKRVLAYSSIAHIGYLMVAFLAGTAAEVSAQAVNEAVSFYLVAYIVTTLGALGVVSARSKMYRLRDVDHIEDYRGLFWHSPLLAIVLSLMLLSLAGIPLTVGFVGKFYVFTLGVSGALWWLLGALILASAIGLYYYLRIILMLFSAPDSALSRDGNNSAASVSFTDGLVLLLMAALLIGLGLYPQPLINLVNAGVI